MAYNSTVPASGNTPAQDRSVMQGNFAQIQTSYDTDHVALSSGANVGQHVKITYSNKITDPYAVSGNQSYLFASTGTDSGSQLVYQPTVVTTLLPVSPKAVARLVYSTGSSTWSLDASSLKFNASSGSGTSGEPTLTFTTAFADTKYFCFAMYEASGATSVASTTKSAGSVIFRLITSFRAVANGDTIAIWVF